MSAINKEGFIERVHEQISTLASVITQVEVMTDVYTRRELGAGKENEITAEDTQACDIELSEYNEMVQALVAVQAAITPEITKVLDKYRKDI
jgi:hypothetical protein